MENTSVGQRFMQLIQQLGLSKNAFAMSLDKTATVIQHLVDERNKPGFDLMRKVFEVYPNVSKTWLIMGEGPMLLDGVNGAATLVPADSPAHIAPIAAIKPPAAPATPSFPAPLFAVSAARQPSAEAIMPPAEPVATGPELIDAAAPEPALPAPPVNISQPAPAPPVAAEAAPTIAPPVAPSATPGPVPAATPPATPAEAAYLTAALHAQHLQHQLALAEQRNQYLLEQQKLILERQVLMQQMLDFLRRPV